MKASDENWEEFSARIFGGGNYEFEDLHPGAWDVSVSCPGFLSRQVRWNLEADQQEHEEDIVLDPAIVVAVRIHADLPKELAWFESLDRLGVSGLGEHIAGTVESQGTRVDPNLLYALRYRYPRLLDLLVIPTSEEPGPFLESDLAASSPIGRFRTRGSGPAPFGARKLRGGRMRELTLSDTGVVAAIEARAGNLAGPRILADGRRLDDLSPESCGVLELSESPPLFANLVAHGCVLASVPIPPGATEVAIPLRQVDLEQLVASAHLTVVDAESGAGIQGAKVEIDFGLEVMPKQASRDGSLTIPGLMPGPATLRIQSTDRETVEDEILLRPGSTTELGIYRLSRFSRSEVVVRDADGNPQPVSFDIFSEEGDLGTRGLPRSRRFRSNSEGILKINRIGCGRYVIVARDENWASLPVVLDTTLRDTSGYGVRVEKPTKVALRLRGEPPPNGRLVVRTQSGVHVEARRCRSSDPIRFALAPGSYTAELFDGDMWLWSEGIAVGADPVRRWLPR